MYVRIVKQSHANDSSDSNDSNDSNDDDDDDDDDDFDDKFDDNFDNYHFLSKVNSLGVTDVLWSDFLVSLCAC